MKIGIANATLATDMLSRALRMAGNHHQIIWIVQTGSEAMSRCREDRPDLLLVDLMLPGINGAELIRRVMADTPCAILLLTSDPNANLGKVSEAMGAGALDVVTLPANGAGTRATFQTTLIPKLKLLDKIVSPKALGSAAKNGVKRAAAKAHCAPEKLVAIGASAGGPAALAAILSKLPRNFSAPIVVVQHVDEKFATGLASWLSEQTTLRVRLAKTGDQPCPGEVLIAGSDDHLILTDGTTLGYTPKPTDYAYRPSVDVFFESVARHWRGDLLAVLLTGMGRDGANGLKTLREKGYRTIAQDEATSAIYGMPKHAAAIGAAVDILPLHRIAPELEKFSLTPLR